MIQRIVKAFGTDNQTKIAREIGIKLQTINHIFAGRNKVSLDVIAKIHYARPNISLNWLIFGEGEMYIDNQLSNCSDEPTNMDIPYYINAPRIPDEQTRNIASQCLAKLSMVSESNASVIAQIQALKEQNDKIIETCNTLIKAIH